MFVVALIWAAVIYRFFSFVDGSKNIVSTHRNNELLKLPVFEKDTFKLHKNFRDPFLGKTFSNANTTNHPRVVHTPKPVITPQTIESIPKIPFPEVVHLGIVNNASNSVKTHMVSIAGTTHMITKLGKYGGLEVIDIQKDLVKIKFNDEVKIFHP